MELRVPSGASLIDVLLGGATTVPGLVGGDASIPDVTPAQLDEAIGGLVRGDIEYLALHQGAAFVQVAGEGDGPYLLEASLGQVEDQVQVPGGVTLDGVRHAVHGFLAGDATWPQAFAWADAGLARLPAPARRSWFRRR